MGPSEEGSLWRNPDPSEPQEKGPVSDNPSTDHSESALRGDQLSQAKALPVSETPREKKLGENPRQFVTFSETPSQGPEFEWESPVLSNSPFTPGLPLHHVELARQFDRRPEHTVLFTSDFAKQLETERRMSSIPMTDPQSETNQNQIKTMDTVVSQAQAQAQKQAQVQAQLQTQQPQVQSPVRQLPNPNIPSTVPFIPIPQGAAQNPVRITITGTIPKTNLVATLAAWRNPVQDITLESNTTGND